MKAVFWGAYDLGKPRNRILLKALRAGGIEVVECHKAIWDGIEDKSRLLSGWQRLRCVLRWLAAYPALCWRYLRLPAHDLVIIGYMGQLDVLVIRPLAWLRRVPVVWDTYLSLHDTVVDDRALVHHRHPVARLLYAWEWLAVRAADRLLVDTEAHGRFFSERFGVPLARTQRVFVGAEPEAFYPSAEASGPAVECFPERPFTVLFYGQFIPLHGMETIVRAAHLCAEQGIRWHVIGDGQEKARFVALLDQHPGLELSWRSWLPYGELVHCIHEADICLGIFGTSGKAGRVIPNKVFQALAAGSAVITADTSAARELLEPGAGVALVPPGDPEALAVAICAMRGRDRRAAERQIDGLRERITPQAIGRELADGLRAWYRARG